MTIPYTAPIQYGWVCPKCGRVYAPATPSCMTCPQTFGIATTAAGKP